MKRYLFFIFIIGCFSSEAQTKFVNEFLNIGVGARAHGMFGSVVASSEDGTSAYWNPAGLASNQAPLQINAMHANWFGGIANYDYGTIVKKIGDRSSGALTIIRMGVDNIPNTLNLVGPDGSINYNKVETFSASDVAFLLSYGSRASTNDKWSYGGSVKVIRRSIGEFGGAWGFGADVGVRFKMNDNLTFGLMGRDITTTVNSWVFTLDEDEKEVFQSTGNDIPVSSTETSLPRLILGGAYRTNFSQFSLLSEMNLNLSTNGTQAGVLSGERFSVDPSLGLELGYIDRVYIRAGLGNLQRLVNDVNADQRDFDIQPNVGLGLKFKRLRIDYALANVGNVSGALASHIFSVSLDFKPRQTAQTPE